MKSRLNFRPLISTVLSGALYLTCAAYAQNTSNTSTNAQPPSSDEDQHPDKIELCPFGGVSVWGDVTEGLGEKLADGAVYGGRFAYNPTAHLGLELWLAFDEANVTFNSASNGGVYPSTSPFAGEPTPRYSFHADNWMWGLNPVLNLRRRGAKFQPYVTVGVGGIQFTPTDHAETVARDPVTNAGFYSGNLNDNLQLALNYGGGIKWHLSDHFGLRLDARGFWSRNPTYDLPNYNDGGIYIPAKDKLNGLQATLGLVFYFGQPKCPPMPPAPAPPAALTAGAITGGEGATICQGKPVILHSTAAPGTAGHPLSYDWTLNGQASGSNSPDFTFTPNSTGDFTVAVTVTDTAPPPAPMQRPKNISAHCWVQPPTPQGPAPVSASTTITVQETAPAIASVTVDPNTLACPANTSGTHSATLTGAATPSACGGNLTYKWSVTEGGVTNETSPSAIFDASTINFEGGAQGQTKTVTATLTVTDETGKTASKTADITINCQPQFVRLSDVVFAKNNARVNNCGKRILIDEAAPRAATGDYDIVLVGHRDNDERADVAEERRARHGRHTAAERALDEQRTLNAAAVLSGGTGTCGHVDPAHIRVDWVGTDQTSDAQPGLCGTSNLPSQTERRGSQTSAADKNRRVEVYLVPRNSTTMPPAVKNIKPLPEQEAKALGCPR